MTLLPRAQRERGLAAGAVAAAVLATFSEALLTSRVFYERDIHAYWYPHMVAFHRAVAERSLPLWNPWIGFGAPFLADATFELAYPPTWLSLVVPLAVHFKLMAVGHALLAAAGAFVLSRLLGLRPAAAAAGAGAYALSGPFLSSLGTLHHYPGAAWLPWVMAALERLIRRPGPGAALGLGVAAGAQLLAGSGDLCLMTGLLGAGRLSFHVVSHRPAPRELMRLLRPALAAGVLALALGAAQWLPTADRAVGGPRAGQDLRTRTYWSLHPASLVDLAVPRLVADAPLSPPSRRALFEGREPFLACIYVGTLTLVLAVLGLLLRTPGAVPVALGASLGLAAALGRHAPLYAVLGSVPGLSLLRYPQKYLLPVAFGLAVLAALGVEALAREWTHEDRRRGRALALGLLGVAGALVAAALWLRTAPGGVMELLELPDARLLPHQGALKIGRTAVLLALPALVLWRRAARAPAGRAPVVAVLVLGAADLVAVSRGINPLAPADLLERKPPVLAVVQPGRGEERVHTAQQGGSCLSPAAGPPGWKRSWVAALGFQETLRPPTGVRWGLFGSFDGEFTGLGQPGSARLTALVRDRLGTEAALRLLQLGGVGHVLFVGTVPPRGLGRVQELPSPYECPLQVLSVPDRLPRAYVASAERRVGPKDDLLARLQDPAFDPRHEVLLADGRAASPTGAGAGIARVVSRTLNTLDVEAELSRPGVLVVLEAYDEGWRVAVDGVGAAVLRANGLFRAVRLPAGRHRVRFSYEPAAARLGLALSLAGLAALLTLAALARRAGRGAA